MMRTGLASVRDAGGLDSVDQAVRRFEDEWQHGEPDLGRYWEVRAARGGSVSVLAALIKSDLRCRHARDERPAVADYLERFPALREHGDRVLSLVYEEYCLLEERGENPDAAEFCARYAAWKDSLASQLRYHRAISRVVGASPPPTRFPEPGDRFEQFRIVAELGRGGAARVYLAEQSDLGGRLVALKVAPDRGSEPSILGRMEHPHIVPVLTSAVEASTRLRGLCMPYRPGLPLDEVIRRVSPGSAPRSARALWDVLPPPPAGAEPSRGVHGPERPGWDGFPVRGTYAEGVAWVVMTLAEALAYAHDRGVLHLDVKPANVLLTHRDGPQLLDFNLAHDPHAAPRAEAALRGGTLPYMAPEQLGAFLDPDRWSRVSPAADLYSLGLLMRELLTGEPPEPPDPSLPLTRAIRGLLDRRPDFRPDLRRFNPTVPHALESVVETCLACAPEGRYPDAAALAEDLRRFLASRPLRHAPNRSPRERAGNLVRRNRVALASAAALTGLLAAGLVARDRATSPAAVNRVAPPAPAVAPADPLLKAVSDLKNKRFRDALGDLERLSRREPVSPVVRFYLAATYTRIEQVDDALDQLERLRQQGPEAEAELVAWGKDQGRRAFTSQAAAIGDVLLASEPARDPFRRGSVLDLACYLLRVALQVDPDYDPARQELALVAEQRGRYDEAQEALTTLIAHSRNPVSPKARLKRRRYFQTRARVLTRWAQDPLLAGAAWATALAGTAATVAAAGDAGAADLSAAEAHLRQALDDIRDEFQLVQNPLGDVYFEINYVLIESTFSLGDVYLRQGHRARAAQCYLESKNVIDWIEMFGVDEKFVDHHESLAGQVSTRLEALGFWEDAIRRADRDRPAEPIPSRPSLARRD